MIAGQDCRARGAGGALLLLCAALAAPAAGAQTLPEVVRRALVDHPRLAEARSAVDAATAEIDVAQSAGNLRVSVDGGVGAQRVARESTAARTILTPAIRARKLVADGGRVEKDVDLRKSRVTQARAAVRVAEEDTAFQIAQAYVETARNKAILMATRDWIEGLAQIESLTREIANIDRGRRVDFVQASSRVQVARAQGFVRQAALAESARQLNELANQKVFIETPVSLVHVIDAKSPAEDVLRQHPRVQVAQAGAEVAQSQLALDELHNRPRFDVEGFVSAGPDGRGKTKLVNALGVQLVGTGNIMDGGAGQALVNVDIKRLSQARNAVDATLRETRAAVERTLGAEEDRDKRIAAFAAVVRQSQEVRSMMLEQFRGGRRPLLDLLTQENEIHQAALAAVQEEYDAILNRVRLAYSRGELLHALNVPSAVASR